MALLLLPLGALLAGLVASLASDADPVVWASGDSIRLDCVLPLGSPLQTRRPPPPLEADTDVQSKNLYKWTVSGEEINPKRIFLNGSLEVRRRDGSGNIFQCSVKKHGGVVLGYPRTVKFPFIEKKFQFHPTNNMVMIGQPVMFNCSISSEPAASYAWTKNGNLLSTDTRVHFINNQLFITEVKEDDQGEYKCIATNQKLNKSRTSHEATLSVELQTSELKPDFLFKDNIDQHVTVEANGTAVLTCPVVGYPRPEITWLFIPHGISMELDVVSQVLERPQFSVDQEGMYVCSINNHNLKKVFHVSMSEPVNITHPPTSKEPRRASTVRLNCNVTGKPEPLISWYRDGKPVVISTRVRPMVANYENNLRQLVISSVTADDAGIYQCFATTPHSQASRWAVLTVPGDGGPKPQALTCRPIDANTVNLSWTVDKQDVVAYTIHAFGSSWQKQQDRTLTSGPVKVPEATVTLARALSPEQFQVRAYVTGAASDMSEPVTCQGQGVPLQLYRDKSGVIVSWEDFAHAEPDVKQWRVQLRDVAYPHTIDSIDLDANTTTYLTRDDVEVRVLGTKTDSWEEHDLSLLTWSSTAHASSRRYGLDEIPPAPEHLEIKKLTSTSVSLRWKQLDGAYTYSVCVSRSPQLRDGSNDCQDTTNAWILISNLIPNTVYTASVVARGLKPGPPSKLLGFTTNPEELSRNRLTNLTGTYVNATTIKVSWSVSPPKTLASKENYTINYSSKLKLPVNEWSTLIVHDNFVYLTGVNPKDITYVMVTAYNPEEHSTIITIPPHVKHAAEVKKNQISWEYSPSGLMLHWSGGGYRHSCEVSWSQNITEPVETWPTRRFTDLQVSLSVPDPALTTFVSVRCGAATDMLTVPGIPKLYNLKQHSLYLGIGVGCAVCLIVVLTVSAIIYIRNRRKSNRSRRRRKSDGEEEGAELKSVGVRLANGAGQPLLNGHVHITENPALSKTPNGKVLKAKYEAFDLSRATDLDETALTTLDADTSASSLLDPDTSIRRLVDPDTSSRRLLEATKLPDDNMNSEVSSSQPTLQPNG